LVPQGSEDVLRQALRDAAIEWYRGLGPVFDRLEHYLKGSKYEGFIARARDKWETRRAEAEADPTRWPEFLVEWKNQKETVED
jgi:hypothetical protein